MRQLTELERERLRVKILDASIPVPFAGCRLWLGGIGTHGYAAIRVPGLKWMTTGQRAAWLAWRGPIPRGMSVLHRCDTEPCVEWTHLFLGTPADNMIDKQLKGRARRVLAPSDIELIRARHAQGMSHRELGREFGVSHSMIGYITRGRNWSHVA